MLSVVEIGHCQLRACEAAPRSEEHQELRQVALVGADGVLRGVLVQTQVLEEFASASFIVALP